MCLSTAIKKALALAAMTAVLGPAVFGEWRRDAARLIGPEKQYAKAAELIQSRWADLPDGDKADASVLLAFCASKIGDTTAEIRWIVEYFETALTRDSGFAFLDFITQADVIGFINGWRMKYPWISGVSMVKGIGDQVIMPEGILPLVVEISNPAYYKFSENGVILKAGLLAPGFNILALDANTLFLASGRRLFSLEIKSDNLILTKEIALDVTVTTTRPRAVASPPPPSRRPLEYSLTLYIDGRAVLASHKTIRSMPLDFGLEPSKNPYGFKPDYVLNRDKPNPMNSLNLIQAVSVLYQLLKDLFSRKNKDAEPPKIQTVQDLTLNFISRDSDGLEYATKAVLKLTVGNKPYTIVPTPAAQGRVP